MALWLFLSIFLAQAPIPRIDTGTVSGVVRLPDGKPAVGVRVAAMVPPDGGLNPGNASELTAIGKTDDSGRYRLEDVPVGRYYIVAGRVDAPTFYPGVPNMTGATALSVTAGAAIAEIDFVISAASARPPDPMDTLQQYRLLIPSVPPLQVPGRIVMDANSPDKNLPMWVTLNARNDGNPKIAIGGLGLTLMTTGSYTQRAPVAPDGSFTVPLTSGESTISVQALPEGYTVKSATSGSTNLLARPINVQTGMAEIVIVLTADLRPRFTVAGRVVTVASRSVMGEHIELIGNSGLISRIILDAQGEFVFRKLLPGNYVLRPAADLKVPEQRITVTDHDVTAIEVGTPR
jgi:hypothetical protein